MYIKKVVMILPVYISFVWSSEEPLKRVKRGAGGLNVELTRTEKEEIVKRHNDLRRSSGSSDMRHMTWDRELSLVAEEYGKACQYKHNQNTKHSVYKSIGENIYASTGQARSFKGVDAVQMWFDEIKDYNFDTRTCTKGKMCGHYTQVVWANTYKVGCSLTVCDLLSVLNWKDSIIFICNYAPAGNVVKWDGERYPPFKKGASCSQCSPGDTCNNKLCANKERDKLDEFSDLVTEGYSGLVAVIIILVIILLLLSSYILYRERHRVAVRIAFMGKNRSRFSNQSTPIPSRTQTPRSSLTPGNLHGVNNEITNNRVQDLRTENKTRKPASAPVTPTKQYLRGSPLRPAPPKLNK